MTTEAHSQSAKDSQSSLDERDAENESQLAAGVADAPATNAAPPDIDIEIEDPDEPRQGVAATDPETPAPDVNTDANATASGGEVVAAATEPSPETPATDASGAPLDAAADVTATNTAAANSNGELDFEKAERYAASFRPSWEPDFPVTPMIPPAQIVGATGGKARVVRHNTRGDLTAPKLRKHRSTSYAILAGSLMGMAALFYTAVHSSSVSPAAEVGRESVETQVHAARTKEAPPASPEPSQPSAASAPDAPTAVAAAPSLEQPAVDPAAPAAELAAEPGEEAPAEIAETFAAQVEPAPEPELAAGPAAPQIAAAPAEAAPSPQANAESDPPPSAAEAAAAPETTPAEPPTKVLLSLAAHPPTTRLRLDGVPIDNPFRARLPRSSTHRIEARAPGFTPEVHSLRLEADVQLMISLKREPGRDVKSDPYRQQGRSAVVQPAPTRNRGAGFVAENPY